MIGQQPRWYALRKKNWDVTPVTHGGRKEDGKCKIGQYPGRPENAKSELQKMVIFVHSQMAEKNAKGIQILHLFILNPPICTALKLILLKEQFYPTCGHPRAVLGQAARKIAGRKIFKTKYFVVVQSNIRNLESKSFCHWFWNAREFLPECK